MNKHLKYISYLLRHKWFVLVAGIQTGAPLWRLIIHDWSKFLPLEWLAYANFFYGPWRLSHEPDQKLVEGLHDQFDVAWLHHQHLNPHHWQYWILREDSGLIRALEMPNHFVAEMVADWAGAGRTITGRWEVLEWYASNDHKIILHPETRLQVLEILVRHFTP